MKFQNNQPILQLKDIHVLYDDIKALKGVDFNLFQGEIHALVGEHRAGKSTLVKVLSGAVRKDRGEIFLKGQKIDYFTPLTAIKNNIGMVYQNINIVPTLNAVENIFAGQMIRKWNGFLNHSIMLEKTIDLFSKLKVKIRTDFPLNMLSEAEQQMVELARVLSYDPDIIILDEISSKLNPQEMENIYQIIFDLKTKGKSIIYISHNMDEIFEFSDRVTILKDGYRRGTEEINNLDRIKLIKLTYSFIMSREELEQDNKELYFFKKYNENIIKNIPVGVIILDRENKIYLMNYAAITILDIKEKVILDQDMKIIFNRNSIKESDKIVDAIKLRKKKSFDELNFQNDKIVKVNIFPFKDEDYKFLGTIILIEDITKDRDFKNYLLRTEKITSVAELAAGVAHEINNPLGIILNYVTLLKKKKNDKDSANKLQKVETELNRIAEIIGGLLSFSKLKNFPMRKINIIKVLDEVVILLRHRIKSKKINFIWDNEIQEVIVLGDENKLKQVFINLLINSIEAVLENGYVEIKLNQNKKDEYVEISIIDNGYGIPKDIIEKIFDPFFSSKAGKNNTGLGLSVCQHIIESHQGIISCSSDGKNTIFNVRLTIV
jgi:two-component system sensor histidine kinase AtoS